MTRVAFTRALRQMVTAGRKPAWFGDLRRTQPISRLFGFDRGTPIDRYYIERFLGSHAGDIRGDVLEVGDDGYTRRFGAGGVRRSDVLDAAAGTGVSIVGDLATGRGVPATAYDCFIATQTFTHIFDVQGAVRHARRALKPGGVLLASVPGISQISRYDMDRWGDFWRFTTRSVEQLFAPLVAPADLTVTPHGNVLAAAAFLYGLAAEELTPAELDARDDDYQVVITVRAVAAR